MLPAQDNKLKVGMIISTYYPAWGGAQRQLNKLGSYLKAKNVEAFILTRRLPKTKRFEVIDGIPVYRVFVTNRSRLVDSICFTLLSCLWLLRNRNKFDILHCYQIYSPATIGTLIKSILKSKKVVVKVTSSNEYGEINEIKRLPFTGYRIKLLKKVDAFFAVNQQIMRELASLQMRPEKIKFIPNGVDIPADGLLSQDSKAGLRLKTGLAFKKIAIFSGRITKEKNLVLLLEAWARIITLHPEAHLVILGEGGKDRNTESEIMLLRERLNIKNSVHLLGKVNNVSDYLLAADIFILPSVSEGLSNSLLEAMAAGLGILASDNEGNRQLIRNGENGILINPNDHDDFSRSLHALLSDDQYCRRLGERARSTVKKDFSIDLVAQQYVNLYRNLVEGSG